MDDPSVGSDALLLEAYARTRAAVSNGSSSDSDAAAVAVAPTLPGPRKLTRARASLPKPDDPTGYLQARGFHGTLDHILTDIAPALSGQNRSSRYWGFVTGASLPIAEAADNVVSAYDQNVQVHLPGQTIATEVEDAALRMLVHLLGLGPPGQWAGRTLTTGATASNILGLACGREAVVAARLPPSDQGAGVGELGVLRACLQARISDIRVLTSASHSSLAKAAAVVGLGRAAVRELPHSPDEPWRLDLDAIERELQRDGVASIIAVSAGEVNTGRFATDGLDDMQRLRQMADQHGAWIHVDGAFGIFARALPLADEFSALRRQAAGLELADSITVDGHKLLNVPYDTGIFFTRKASVLTSVCKNPNAVYLSAGAASDIESPLNVGLENSRRFRALPVYAVLLSEGAQGIAEMLANMVRLARGIASVVRASPDYKLLSDHDAALADTYICVLFRAKDDALNEMLVKTINKTCQWFVSGTRWGGQSAVRVAVANWRVNVEQDVRLVADSLARIAKEHRDGKK